MSAASALTALAFLGLGSASAWAQPYSLTDLGVLPKKGTDGSVPAAINDQGHVVGTSRDSAFRYQSTSKEPMEDLTRKLPGATSRGFGINESGLAVGDSTFGGNGLVIGGGQPVSRAALFKEGSATDLGTLKNGGFYSRANSINASSQVVGFSGPQLDSTLSRAFIWSSVTGMMDLGTLGGAYAQAWGINDSGFVTGNAQTVDKTGPSHAFMWQAGARMRDLGTLAGDFSYGTFINAKNHVVGYSTLNKENDRVHAFIFDGTKMRDLGSLGGNSADSDQSFALGVNLNDEVVGYTYLPSERVIGDGPLRQPRQVGFLYRNGVMTDLNSLIGDASKTYWIQSATAINNKGQIAAVAFDNNVSAFRAVLLTPADAPAGALKTLDASSTGFVKITNAAYSAVNRALVIEATHTESPNRGGPTLEAFYVSGRKIGTLSRTTDGTYAGKWEVATKPQEIEVLSSLGGSDRVMVKDSSGLTPAKR